jgi:hypothetical protein
VTENLQNHFYFEFEFLILLSEILAVSKIKIVPSPDVGHLRKNHIHLVVMPIGAFYLYNNTG